MGCKRKHSADSTPEAQGRDAATTGWDFASAGRVKSSDWGHRTRKRVRDNRPEERAIHENTLHKLFSAQRTHSEASPLPSDALPTQQLPKPQKSTLHAFWKQLPAPPVRPISSMLALPEHMAAQLPRCEDCDSPLQAEHDSMDVDMGMGMGSAVESSPFACNDCGKHVCGTCAVVSSTRHCLHCATSGRNSRRWW